MYAQPQPWVLLLAGTLCLFEPASAEQTIRYEGKGTYVATREPLVLANGGVAVVSSHAIVATLEPSDVGFIFGNCKGLAYVPPSGPADGVTDLYCTFTETAADGFAIRGAFGPASGTIEVIGGSGRWQGATGGGTFQRRATLGDRGTYEYSLDMTVP